MAACLTLLALATRPGAQAPERDLPDLERATRP
jgi:hypothetical protein